jgi:hypothetical protein
MGQQIVTLCLTNDKLFTPIDNEIFISLKMLSVLLQNVMRSREQTKPDMVCDMISRAIRNSINAEYFLADAWFATKLILKITVEQSPVAIARMKRNKIKYLFTVNEESILLSA